MIGVKLQRSVVCAAALALTWSASTLAGTTLHKKPTAAVLDVADATVMSEKLQACLKRADDLPDIAAAEATAWEKNGGAREAKLCYAFAEVNRGMPRDAAQAFETLASYFDLHDAKRAVLMHDMAAQQFMVAKDGKDALAQYAAALKIKPDSVESLLGRARVRMMFEHFWEAIDDLNHGVKIDPQNGDLLRQRGLAWMQLGNPKNAEEDFDRAENLSQPASSAPVPSQVPK